MEMLLDNLSGLGANPFAWTVAALAGMRALFTIYTSMTCKVKSGEYQVSREEAIEAMNTVFQPPRSSLILVMLGIVLAIGGLYTLQDATYGPIGLGAIVVGVFLFMTEPTRLQVIGAKTAVFASTLADGEQPKLARDQLGYAYRERAIYEATIALAVVLVLVLV